MSAAGQAIRTKICNKKVVYLQGMSIRMDMDFSNVIHWCNTMLKGIRTEFMYIYISSAMLKEVYCRKLYTILYNM